MPALARRRLLMLHRRRPLPWLWRWQACWRPARTRPPRPPAPLPGPVRPARKWPSCWRRFSACRPASEALEQKDKATDQALATDRVSEREPELVTRLKAVEMQSSGC